MTGGATTAVGSSGGGAPNAKESGSSSARASASSSRHLEAVEPLQQVVDPGPVGPVAEPGGHQPVGAVRARDDGGEEAGLPRREAAGVDAEVVARGRADAVQAGSPLDQVQVELEQPGLGQAGLERHRHQGLARLAQPASGRGRGRGSWPAAARWSSRRGTTRPAWAPAASASSSSAKSKPWWPKKPASSAVVTARTTCSGSSAMGTKAGLPGPSRRCARPRHRGGPRRGEQRAGWLGANRGAQGVEIERGLTVQPTSGVSGPESRIAPPKAPGGRGADSGGASAGGDRGHQGPVIDGWHADREA